MYKMYIVWSVVTVLMWSHCVEMKRHTDKNDKWRDSDTIVMQIDDYYLNLPVYTEEAGDQHKRFYSIVSLALYMYVKSDVIDDVQRAKEAVAKTREQLGQPADVIGSPMRSLLILLQSVVLQPIIDIKASCPPNATQIECDKNLNRMREHDEMSCHGYNRNVELYNLIANKEHAQDRYKVLKDVLRAERGSDEHALSFFERAATHTHKDFFVAMNKAYKKLLHGPFPCHFPLIPLKK